VRNYKVLIFTVCVLLCTGAIFFGLWSVDKPNSTNSETVENTITQTDVLNQNRQIIGDSLEDKKTSSEKMTLTSKFVTFDSKPGSSFSHIGLIPIFDRENLVGYEVHENSSEYELQDFGFLSGDKITHIDSESMLTSSEIFAKTMSKKKNNETVFLTINRNNETLELELDLD